MLLTIWTYELPPEAECPHPRAEVIWDREKYMGGFGSEGHEYEGLTWEDVVDDMRRVSPALPPNRTQWKGREMNDYSSE